MPAVCPKCHTKIVLPDGGQTQSIRCPKCKTPLSPEPQTAQADPSPRRLEPGDLIGGCRIEEMLGAGAMGNVYRANQLSLGRQVAVKALPGRFASQPDFVERFGRESAALASLNHPNIVSIYDRGQDNGVYFFIMEYVEGQTLRHAMKQGLMPEDRVFQIMEQMCSALNYAHRVGIVHRDIKPRNIMINEQGRVKIADFGLAFLVGENASEDKLFGTRGYMAPEQVKRNAQVDGRADLYAAAVVLYEMLVGKRPGADYVEPTQARSGLHPALDYTLYRGLQPDPARRYQTPIEMLADIRMVANGQGAYLAACPQCGASNAPDLRACANCQADLSDLFDACPKCGKESRRDLAACPHCGHDLAAYRRQVWAQVASIRDRAAALQAQGQFPKAIDELRNLTQFKGREFIKVAVSADALASRIEHNKGATIQAIRDNANKLCQQHKYAQAVILLDAIPKDVLDVSADIAFANAQIDKRGNLADQGDALWKQGDIAGARQAYGRAYEIWPDNDDLRDRMAKADAAAKLVADKTQAVVKVRAARNAGQIDEALKLCEGELRQWPESPGLDALLAQLKLEQAKAHAAKAVRNGDELAQAGKWKEAVDEWGSALPLMQEPDVVTSLEGRIANAKRALFRRRAIMGGIALVVIVVVVAVLAS